MDSISSFCHALPKAELHAHLHGSVRMTTLSELLLSVGEHEKLDPSAKALLTDMGSRSLSDCFAIFKLIHSAVRDSAAVCRILRETLEDFESENTLYLELRTTPRPLLASFAVQSEELPWAQKLLEIHADLGHYVTALLLGMAAEEAVRAADKTREKCVLARVLLSLNRTDSVANWTAIVDLAIAASSLTVPLAAVLSQYPFLSSEAKESICQGLASPPHLGPFVVGIDVSGDPTRGDLRPLFPLLDRARKATSGQQQPLKISFHAAEVMNVKETEAIIDSRPDRLGHACVLAPSSMRRLLEPVHRKKGLAVAASAWSSSSSSPPLEAAIPIEICPTSNALTLNLPGIEHHPTLSPWLEHDHPFCINTDDSGVFGVSLSSEHALVMRAMNLSRERMASVALRALDFAFLSDEGGMLAKIKQRAAEEIERLLKGEGDC